MTGAQLVAVGDPDGPIPVARFEVKINPVDGAPLLDVVVGGTLEHPDALEQCDILLTGCRIERAGMHLDAAQPGYSYVLIAATATGVAVVPRS